MGLRQKLSVVIPARDEEATVATVVQAILSHPTVSEVVVVDNASRDRTAELAEAAGAVVVNCANIGVGFAMKAGIYAASEDHILRTDADITDWQPWWLDALQPIHPKSLTRGIYHSPYNVLPMSNYVVRPFLKLYAPDWEGTPIPTTGTYIFDRRDYDWSKMPDGWAIDIAILLETLRKSASSVRNVDIGKLTDRQRGPEHYIPMATELISYLTKFFMREIIDSNISR
jgi:glucosyl-3-phosphoglycerate synthase